MKNLSLKFKKLGNLFVQYFNKKRDVLKDETKRRQYDKTLQRFRFNFSQTF
jgi:curved DNA-binding protein CbpA